MKQFNPFFLLLLLFAPVLGFAQPALPATFTVASGTYTFSVWDSLAATGTYPANMIFHYTIQPENTTNHVYDSSAEAARNYNCSYNLKSRNRILGLGQNGFAFIATGTAQYNDCTGSVSSSDSNRYVGAAVLGLNTSGKTNIGVKWNSAVVVPADGNGDTTMRRQYTVRLQYRVGTAGNYTDVTSNGAPVEFTSTNKVVGAVTTLSAVLPAACNNQPVVYLRWNYFAFVRSGSGTRPEISVDEIQVGADLLPLRLLSFVVENKSGTAMLHWKTGNEENVSRFEVERSADAAAYLPIATVAARNGAGVNDYTAMDTKPGSGKCYYRLKIVDKDGSYAYSNVVEFTTKESSRLTIYPNPVTDYFVLSHPQATIGATITILGYDGRKIAAMPVVENTLQTKVATAALSKGNYLLLFWNGMLEKTVRFTKQ